MRHSVTEAKSKKPPPLADKSFRASIEEKRKAALASNTRWMPLVIQEEMFHAAEKDLIAGYCARDVQIRLRTKYQVSKSYAITVVSKVYKEWVREEETDRKNWKQSQMKRVLNHIRDCRVEGEWHVLAQFENLFAKMAGTMVPVEVRLSTEKVDLIGSVLAGVDEARLQEFFEAHKTRERALQLAGLSVPALDGGRVIEVQPEDVEAFAVETERHE